MYSGTSWMVSFGQNVSCPQTAAEGRHYGMRKRRRMHLQRVLRCCTNSSANCRASNCRTHGFTSNCRTHGFTSNRRTHGLPSNRRTHGFTSNCRTHGFTSNRRTDSDSRGTHMCHRWCLDDVRDASSAGCYRKSCCTHDA
jgi:hypothetical protein